MNTVIKVLAIILLVTLSAAFIDAAILMAIEIRQEIKKGRKSDGEDLDEGDA